MWVHRDCSPKEGETCDGGEEANGRHTTGGKVPRTGPSQDLNSPWNPSCNIGADARTTASAPAAATPLRQNSQHPLPQRDKVIKDLPPPRLTIPEKLWVKPDSWGGKGQHGYTLDGAICRRSAPDQELPHLVFLTPQPDGTWICLDDTKLSILPPRGFIGKHGTVLVYNQIKPSKPTMAPQPPIAAANPTDPLPHQDLCDAHPIRKRDPKHWHHRLALKIKKLHKLTDRVRNEEEQRSKHVISQHALSLLNQAVHMEFRLNAPAGLPWTQTSSLYKHGHIPSHSHVLRKYLSKCPDLPKPPPSWDLVAPMKKKRCFCAAVVRHGDWWHP
eukprot:g68570.t1